MRTIDLATAYLTVHLRLRSKPTSNIVNTYHERHHWHADTLSENFADDIRLYQISDLKAIKADNRREVWDLLRARGVYVPKGQNMLIADRVFAVVQENIP